MGNLLGSPITEKDTHVGTTHDSHPDASTSPDGGGLAYGISSMQGWRIHMEDAHIAQPFLYAEKVNENYGGENATDAAVANAAAAMEAATPSKKTAIETTLSKSEDDSNDNDNTAMMTTQINVTENTMTPSPTPTPTSTNGKYIPIPLPNHSLFAVFDGHGGSFAAEYAARNLLRVLCRSPTFVEYAEKWSARDDYLQSVKSSKQQQQQQQQQNKNKQQQTKKKAKVTAEEANEYLTQQEEREEGAAAGVGDGGSNSDEERLRQLQKRSRESDEKTGLMKEQVRKHLDGEDTTTTAAATTAATSSAPASNSSTATIDNSDYEFAKATYDHALMTLLEHSLRDAFVDLDTEILRVVRGEDGHPDANSPYGAGYDLSMHTLQGCVGHLPKEAKVAGESEGEEKDDTMNNSKEENNQNNNHNSNNHNNNNNNPPHPIPSDDEDAGTTAVAVLLTPLWIICANAGDSRAVYSRSSHRAVPLSYDHKPEDEDEERRVREAGGYVSGGRVEGDLAVSRGLGDFRFKDLDAVLSGSAGENRRMRRSGSGSQLLMQRGVSNHSNSNSSSGGGGATSSGSDSNDMPMMRPSEQKVSPVPDIIVQNRNFGEDEFIVIACDGIWDVQTNQECVRMVADVFEEGEEDLGLVCEEILDLCLIKGSKDNMTAAVIKLPKQDIGKGGGVMARRERRGAASPTSENNNSDGIQQQPVVLQYVSPGMREAKQEDDDDDDNWAASRK
eukprot:CAMPEP_0183765896 /NCGR_PEP_ID=MMETSP0739-20130205/11219_1 /TAXON_ID=385413 /ORGANISM="Thalassiosira miniscula, Strain CCMP1093" /LENGTH=728 /DNA_ID=CAMNT_0026004617 /DNA_START=39 /DNA_END=2225 /DNA_ORIENTATION=+